MLLGKATLIGLCAGFAFSAGIQAFYSRKKALAITIVFAVVNGIWAVLCKN